MKKYAKPFIITLSIIVLSYAFWPLLLENIATAKASLIWLKKYCLTNPWTGYFLYSVLLCLILFIGIPLANIAILISGVIYGFWEAVTIVTVCRLLTAGLVFYMVRQVIDMSKKTRRRTSNFIRKFERHPKIAMVVARLTPLPDSVVNYTLATSPISNKDYLIFSLIGMIPYTIVCVWAGNELGSVTHLIKLIS